MSAQVEMFPEMPAVISPRLAWLRKHHLKTWATPACWIGMECPETGVELEAWYCDKEVRDGLDDDPVGGADQDDAIGHYARLNGLRLWDETLPAAVALTD